MPVNNSSKLNLDWEAAYFKLKSVDNEYYTLKDLSGENGTVIVFICNHCPYVVSIADRLKYEADELKKIKINTISIMSNDTLAYPEDSFDKMKIFSKKYNFNFPYLIDEDQSVAIKYEAVCTPDFFGFNRFLKLQYRGRIDSKTMKTEEKNTNRDLYNAMVMISKTDKGPTKQYNSFGCSIKWKQND